MNQDSAQFNEAIRRHWGIENQLHWVLDVAFGEDAAKKRKGNSAQNFNIIFKSALTILKREESLKKSIKQKNFKL